jgi:hypothetical protein
MLKLYFFLLLLNNDDDVNNFLYGFFSLWCIVVAEMNHEVL